MLTPTFLSDVAEPIVELWSQVECDIISDIVRRIVKADYMMTSTAKWQTYKLRQMGLSQDEIAAAIAKATKQSKTAVKKMVSDACKEAIDSDGAIYASAGKDMSLLTGSAQMKTLIAAGSEQTNKLMTNFTRTTARTAENALENSLDRIWLQVQSGAISVDKAIRDAVSDLGRVGITKIAYPSGTHMAMESAVRNITVTALNQTAAKVQLQAAALMECDLVEVTSHAGARPSHALWQGGIYSLSGKSKKYKPFRETTGFGTGDGLGGWGCRHSFYPYMEGVSTPTFNKDPNQALGKSNEQVYEESQRQRVLERRVRESRRECVSINTAIKATGSKEISASMRTEFAYASRLLKSRQTALTAFCKESGRTQERDRLVVYGYDRSVSSKVSAAARKAQ